MGGSGSRPPRESRGAPRPPPRGKRAALAAALALFFLALLAGCSGGAAPAREWSPGELRAGGRLAPVAIAPGEVHRYRLPLAAGQFLRLVVEQQGVDAVVALESPRGETLLTADRPVGGSGPEYLLAVAAESGPHVLAIRSPAGARPGRYAARIEVLEPATAEERRIAEVYRRFTEADRLAPEEAVARWSEGQALWRELGEAALEGDAARHLADAFQRQRQRDRAAPLYRAAAEAYRRSGEAGAEARARVSLGSTLLDLAEAEGAAAAYRTSLALARQIEDRDTEAIALYGLGRAERRQGELQGALDHYQQALERLPEGDRNRPQMLHDLGVLHARFLGDATRGRELLAAALASWPADRERQRAATLNQLGQLAYEAGETDEARGDLERSLELLRASEPCTAAVTLARLALVADAGGAVAAADVRLAEALALIARQPCPTDEATVHLLAATDAEGRGHDDDALEGYRRCLSLYEGRGDRNGQAEALAGIARAERARGHLEEALAASRRTLAILAGVRPTVLREDLRTSFFAGVQDRYDFHVSLLLALGRDEAAWVAAEESRARALRDLLAEAGAGLYRHADPALVSREKELQHRLNTLEARRLDLGEGEELEALGRRLDEAVAALEAVHGEIRRGAPGGAAGAGPEAISVAAAQGLLDGDTLLLEYRLGGRESTLWALDRGSLAAYRLPPRNEIEPLAREAARWLRSIEWPGHPPPPLCELSRLLLAPVASRLGGRRLVLVADGALEALAFAALPDPTTPGPCSEAPPLVAAHEIAYLPSAATLAAQRRRLADRRPAPGWLAVVADPAYGSGTSPLPHSGEEAAAVLAGLPRERVLAATGPAASKQTVTSGALAGFRILHFATHGVLDPERPLLSSLALAQLDAGGRPVDGALHAYEIYGLDLPAELVVLSACDTARGRQVRGEGLVSGLPRAFLYAGAARVLVSLWTVPDASTRDLMTAFYRGLLGRGLPPAQALQQAQRALWQAGLPPYRWAAFILVGDWRPLPPLAR
jgi:CHAT domain-containing protein/tetratricopeptide (TPR) repeat protein